MPIVFFFYHFCFLPFSFVFSSSLCSFLFPLLKSSFLSFPFLNLFIFIFCSCYDSFSVMFSDTVWRISSSSSCRAARTDIPDPLSPLLPIVHCFWLVFRVTSRILTELLYVCSSWSSWFCLAIYGGPKEYITDEFVLASPAVSCVSGSSNLYIFRDGRHVAV